MESRRGPYKKTTMRLLQSKTEGSEKLVAKGITVNTGALIRKVNLNGSHGLCMDILKEIYV